MQNENQTTSNEVETVPWSDALAELQQPQPGEARLAGVDDESLNEIVAAAREQFRGLEHDAVDAEQRAAAAQAAFEAEPSAETSSRSIVAQQLAQNARRASAVCAAEVAELENETQRRRRLARMQELLPLADGEAVIGAAHARWRRFAVVLRAELEQEAPQFYRELRACQEARVELDELCGALGMPRPPQPIVNFHRALIELANRLRSEFGPKDVVLHAAEASGSSERLRLGLAVFTNVDPTHDGSREG